MNVYRVGTTDDADDAILFPSNQKCRVKDLTTQQAAHCVY